VDAHRDETHDQILMAGAITAGDLAGVRAAAAGHALSSGLTTDDADRFVVAVSEAVTNVIVHAGGIGDVIVSRNGECVAEITDHGPGFVVPDEQTAPKPGGLHGRGLWLMRQCVDRVTIVSRPLGTRVRLAMNVSAVPVVSH
jgi:anti-sigma regulatory factor (Ser/Thr protein kinase)